MRPRSGTTVLNTLRLRLRWATEQDAPFFVALLNDPDWIRFVSDPGVRNEEQARAWLRERLFTLYQRFDFGLYLVEELDSGQPIGLCGLVKRDSLPEVDLGFGFLPAYRGKGYAEEAARVCIEHAQDKLNFQRLLAITAHDNVASARLLEKLGFSRDGEVTLPGESQALVVFARVLA